MKKMHIICMILCVALFLGGCSAKNEKSIVSPEKFELQKGSAWKVEEFATTLNSYTSPDERLSKMTEVAASADAKLYFDPATCDIAYKTNDGIYFSTPWNLSDDIKSVDTQKQKIASQIRLSFMDAKQNVSEIFSFAECVSKGQYTLERLKNGIRVNMIIGRAEQRTLLPAAITVESYERVRDALQKRGQARLKAFYKLYDSETTSKSQIDVIAQKYPVVTEMPIYVLKNVTDKEKNELEGYFEEAGYTFEDMEKDLEAVGAKEEITVSPRFEVSVQYELINGELSVSIPTELIGYDEKNFTLLEIGALEYFASASCLESGYLFVPDGSGAVVGFNSSGKKLGNDIRIPIYGYDRSLTYTSGYEKLMTASLPVFGIVSSNGSMLAVVDEGAAVTDIIASSGGNSSGYARAGAVFSYCDYDSFEYKDVNTQYSWTLADKNHYNGVYRINYSLLKQGSTYSDMATAYRNRLNLENKTSKELKLVLGMYGSTLHTDEFMFVPVKRQMPLTTFTDATEITEEMLENGVGSLDIRYIGWTKKGMDNGAFTSAKVQSVIGGKGGLKKLQKALKDKNIGLYFDADMMYVANNSLFDGFTAVKDTSRMLDNTYAGFEKVRLSSGLMNEDAFMFAVRPQASYNMFTRFVKSYDKLGVSGISLGSVGSNLNSDKDDKNGTDRGTAQKYISEILTRADEKYSVMIEGANSYCLSGADTVLNISSTASGYPDADYSVPFLQMVLHGKVNYTTSAVNLSGDYRTEVLKAIENGSGLYFEIAYRNAELLRSSDHTDKYSVDYGVWKEQIVDCYKEVEKVIGDLAQETITGHKNVADNVSAVTYSNGVTVYVNYNDYDVLLGDVTVSKGSYTRVEKGE